MEAISKKFEVEKFDGKGDFGLWKYKMLCQLEIFGLGSVLKEKTPSTDVEGEEQKDEKPDPKEQDRELRTKNLISLCLSDLILRKVMQEPTALAMWKALEAEYQTKTLPNRIYMKQRYAGFRMEEHKSIEENMDVFLKLVADLASLDIKISEEDQAIQILTSLPKQYESLVDALKYGSGKEILTVRDVTSSAYSKEVELREKGLLNKSKGNSEGLFAGDNRGRGEKKSDKTWRARSKSNNRSKSRPKFSKECWTCGKEGHFKKQCPERKKPSNSVNIAEEKEEPLVLVASQQATKDEWVLDSGCTFHITPNKDVLFDLEDIEGGKVLMGNNTISEIKGIGKIRIMNDDGSSEILTDVRYMPTMGRNLISYGLLEKMGCRYEGKDFMVQFYKGDKKVISGKYCDGLYYLQGTVLDGEAAVARPDIDLTKRWHSRLGHMSLKGMNILVKDGYLNEKDVKTLEFCENCVLGKAHKLSFPKGKHTTKEVLEYIHSDLWGSPSVVESLGGCFYFVTFIDDFSRKVWIYFLKSKNEVFQNFKEWKTCVETETGKKVKCLRTDNGLEFCNTQMDTLCKEAGIKRHRTCVYTPQQNGVSERMNRTIMEKVRCMLTEAGLEQKFWAEAASTAVYLINRSPSTAINFKLPAEVWSGTKTDLNHLRKFGCTAYVHVTQAKTSPRAMKGVFMGYPDGTKGYRVWLPEELRCTVSRNVIFNEEEMFKDIKGISEKKRKTKKVTFNPVLIQGPSNTTTDTETEDTVQGGVSPASENSEPESASSESEEEVVGAQQENLDNYILARDRIRREVKKPSRFDDSDCVAYALATAEEINKDEPKSYLEARRSKSWKLWNEGMQEEMDSLEKNQTWKLVEKPEKKKIIGSKWVFKLKEGIPGVEKPRYKARLVAKGFSQVEGIDYTEVFAPVVKHVSIRIMLSLVANYDLDLEQLDVKTAFLYGTLDEEIYMAQPEGFVEEGKEDQVCLRLKSLYGLKQSPRQWNRRFDSFMKQQGFEKGAYDPCVYMKGSDSSHMVYLLIYVDDMLIASKDSKEIKRIKDSLKREFEMKDLGAASRILGMDIIRDRKKGTLKLSQGKYLQKVLETFNMAESKAVVTPIGPQFKLKSLTQKEEHEEARFMNVIPYASAVGSLMYAMVGSRPDLCFAVGLISRYMSKPGRIHWEAVKWVMRYLKGALDSDLLFTKGEDFKVRGFCDADYATDLDRRRSVTGYVFQVGGNTISWRSGLQHIVALSTTESEYMALAEAFKEALWLKGFVSELGFKQDDVRVFSDSQSAIHLAKNGGFHERTKHIDTRLHFMRDVIEAGDVTVHKIHTSINPADFLTKCVPGQKFETCLEILKVLP